ncbi:MAG: alpha/beta hydrolase [Chloroflexota bacterium]|nr:alpha/beta hydrolase [Chloroflexota bacterium]
MPKAHTNGIDLYYEVYGTNKADARPEGPKLVLIEGVGYHTWMWYRQIPAFAHHFPTLIYDNRGVGESDKPPGPYSHSQNADDLAGLLDHLGWDHAHVLGVSMGGFIAQEFALRYPERVDKLVLVCTAFGGPNMEPIPLEAQKALTPNPNLTPEQKFRQAMPIAFADPSWPEHHAEEFERIIRWRLEQIQPAEAAVAQLMAGLTFTTEDRLGTITSPTLVIAGHADRVVPPRNAALLAEAIPGARLDIISGAGHLVFIEQAERFNSDVIAFLTETQRESA